jgi:hypothetical protein
MKYSPFPPLVFKCSEPQQLEICLIVRRRLMENDDYELLHRSAHTALTVCGKVGLVPEDALYFTLLDHRFSHVPKRPFPSVSFSQARA